MFVKSVSKRGVHGSICAPARPAGLRFAAIRRQTNTLPNTFIGQSIRLLHRQSLVSDGCGATSMSKWFPTKNETRTFALVSSCTYCLSHQTRVSRLSGPWRLIASVSFARFTEASESGYDRRLIKLPLISLPGYGFGVKAG